jgi:hypothetical protein
MTQFVWTGRMSFAQIAEAIGCDTDEVVAAMPIDEKQMCMVLYSTGNPQFIEDMRLWSVMLVADADGILTKCGEPKEVSEGMQRLQEALDETRPD